MTFPEDALTAPARPAAPPSAVVGYLLNIFLPGSGFTYVGRWGWHLGWAGISVVLLLLAAVLSAATGSSFGLLLPVLGFVGMLVQFRSVYAQQRARHFRPPLELAVKLVLIIGHVVVGFFVTGILAAVLIPNLLGARTRALQTWEQSTAHMVQTQVAVQQIEGTLTPGPCDLTALSADTRAKIASCTVTAPADAEPELDVTFTSGHTVHLP